MKKILIVAGEVSGDQHAAHLVREVRRRRPDVEFFGIGGEALRAEGVRILVDAGDMAVVGFAEVLLRLAYFRRVLRQMIGCLHTEKPDAVLLVDYPGFNLRLAAAAHAAGIPVWYYISPQVWAWRKGRIRQMAAAVDLLMVIFPFEVEVYAGSGLQTVFTGHPLVAAIRETVQQPPAPLPWPAGGPRVALLPGSRRQEIERILPVLLDTARELRRRHPAAVFLIPAARAELLGAIEAQLAGRPAEERAAIAVVLGQMREVVRQSQAAVVCSGTATLETALLNCPMIIVYRTSGFSYWFGRCLVQVPWLGIVNLILRRELCPEFIQAAARPADMADALEPLLENTPARQAQLAGFDELRRLLAEPTAGKSAAQWVAEALGP